MDGQWEEPQHAGRRRRQPEPGKNLIKIPSYQEVFGSGASSSAAPPSYNPPPTTAASSSSSSSSFSQAFSFLKSTEFYSPPPPPPQTTTPSLRYHLLHPDYLYYRIRELQKNFKLRVILCHIDVEDVVKPLHEVTRTSLLHDCTLLCGWSLEECGRYLETIKVYENKSADSIREHMDNDYLSRLTHALTSIRHVNKTDVVTLGSSFGSLSQVMNASMEELARCPGIGERKVKRLHDTFHEPFKRVSSRPNIVVPDTPDREKASGQPSSTIDGAQDAVEKPDASVNKKSSNVRSALTEAFAKYSEKIRNQNRDSTNVAGEDQTRRAISLLESDVIEGAALA
uniref:ERCC1-like central domain-containing protein n=1 Tax=Oryza rufipogon TaxID=4529 RepID=A0A0E0R1G2_ORYRU